MIYIYVPENSTEPQIGGSLDSIREMIEVKMQPTIFWGDEFLHTETLKLRIGDQQFEKLNLPKNALVPSHYTKIECAGLKNGKPVYRVA